MTVIVKTSISVELYSQCRADVKWNWHILHLHVGRGPHEMNEFPGLTIYSSIIIHLNIVLIKSIVSP